MKMQEGAKLPDRIGGLSTNAVKPVAESLNP
jgi:hypothetical protein